MTMKETILSRVYEIYKDNLPEKILYNATTASPVSVILIRTKFKSWDKFVKEYTEYCIAKRNSVVKAVVTKPFVPSVQKTKNV